MTNITPQPIGVLYLYPGISHAVVKSLVNDNIKALVLLSFGVGNAPQDPDFLDILSSASKRGMVIINLTQCLKGHVNM
ncbi:L-asparaginase family protein, partial [Streptomyces scabiei]|uniref:hypothetical protein n=1 Tax=Streptomyces scabiei TaxID=1930 RepID=UPI0038F79CB3